MKRLYPDPRITNPKNGVHPVSGASDRLKRPLSQGKAIHYVRPMLRVRGCLLSRLPSNRLGCQENAALYVNRRRVRDLETTFELAPYFEQGFISPG